METPPYQIFLTMKQLYRLLFLTALMPCFTAIAGEKWHSLFDGESLTGWKASENKETWSVEGGALVTNGPRSHLFYVGEVGGAQFKNFELKAKVKTTPGSNSGIFFHTEYQEEGWPGKGYECQVINTWPKVAPGKYRERKMTGSLYGIRNVWKSPVGDNEWFDYHIIVQGKSVRVYVNGVQTVDYTEPENVYRPNKRDGRLVTSGTFALQGHDPKSVVRYKDIQVKILPDNLPTPGSPPKDLEFEKKIVDLAGRNFPLLDLHVHMKGGLTAEEIMKVGREYGFSYGIAMNCGLKMGFETDAEVTEFFKNYRKPPHSYIAMQAEGREWVDMFSKESVNKFDYVFTDAMTWTNRNGKRMRTWIPEETEVGDPEDFMDQLVAQIETIFSTEAVDIYVNPMYLPAEINDRYDELWTDERVDRVIKVLAENKVALEISNRLKTPRAKTIRKAKAAGVKLTFGTNNTDENSLGRMDYCIRMAQECGLKPDDMWMPGEPH